MSYVVENVVRGRAAFVLAASLTDEPITEVFRLEGLDATAFRIDFSASAVTGSIDIKLQTRMSDDVAWADAKTGAIAATGVTSLKLLDTVAGDQPFLPLGGQCRVVATSGAGEALTLDGVYRARRD